MKREWGGEKRSVWWVRLRMRGKDSNQINVEREKDVRGKEKNIWVERR